MCFIFPIYYRMSLLLGAINVAAPPFAVGAYEAGVFMIMLAAATALAYALVAPSPGYKMSVWNFAKAAFLPTLLIGPILYGLMESYFMVQILSLVIAMSRVRSLGVVRRAFNYPNYLLLGTAGVFLLSYPIRGTQGS